MRRMIEFENFDGGISAVYIDDIAYIQDVKFNRPNDPKAKDYTLVQLKGDNWLKAKAGTATDIRSKVQRQLEIEHMITS